MCLAVLPPEGHEAEKREVTAYCVLSSKSPSRVPAARYPFWKALNRPLTYFQDTRPGHFSTSLVGVVSGVFPRCLLWHSQFSGTKAEHAFEAGSVGVLSKASSACGGVG